MHMSMKARYVSQYQPGKCCAPDFLKMRLVVKESVCLLKMVQPPCLRLRLGAEDRSYKKPGTTT